MACKYTLDGQVLSELEFKQEVARRFANKPIDLNEIAKEFSKGKAIETTQAGSVGVEGENSALKDVESTAKALDESANGEMISIDYGGKKVTNIPTKVNGVDAMYRSASETEVNEILNNNGTTGTFWAEEPIEYQGYGEYLIITNKTTQNETSRISKKSDPLIIIDKRTNKKILNNAGNSSTKKLAEAYHKAKSDGSNPELVKAVEQSLKETPQAEPKVVEKQKGKEVEIHKELVDNLRGFNNNTTKKERTSEQGRIQKQKLIDRAEKLGYRAVEGKDGKLVIIDGKQKIGYRGDAIKKQSLEDKATKEDYRIAYEKALKAEPKDLRTAVMQFLLGGGKVKTSAFKREKRMSGEEYQEISWGLDENAPSLDDVARESFGDFIKGKQQDEADVMTAIADGLADARSKKELEAKFMSENESGEWTEMGLTKEQYQREISRRQEDERISKEEGLSVDDTKETFDDIDSKPITQEEIEKEYNDYQEYLKQKENGEANARAEGTNGKNDAENKGSEKDSAAKKAESKVKEAYAEKIADADAKIEAAKEAKKAEVNALNKRANLFGGDTGAEKNKGLFGAQKDDYAQMDKVVAEYDKKIAEAENAKQKLIDEQEREIKNAVDIEGRQQKMELGDAKKELSSALKDLLDAGDITKF